MDRVATEAVLRGDFESHLLPTKGLVQKVETVFAGFGEKARAKKCKAIVGLLEEGDQMASKNQGSPPFDADRFFPTFHGEGITAGRLGKSAPPPHGRDNYPQPGEPPMSVFPTYFFSDVNSAQNPNQAPHYSRLMLYTLALILIIAWLLGLVSSYTLGGFIHILLILALVLLVPRLAQGKSIG